MESRPYCMDSFRPWSKLMRAFVLYFCLACGLNAQLANRAIMLADVDQPVTPTDSPGGGTYSSTQSVTFSDPTATAIFYTNDGSTTPTCLGTGTLYTGAISTAVTTTYKVIGCNGITGSGVLNSTYTISGGSVTSGWTARFKANTSDNLYTTLGPPYTTNPTNGQAVKVWESVDVLTDDTIWVEGGSGTDGNFISSGIGGLGSLTTNGLTTPWYSLSRANEVTPWKWDKLITDTASTIFVVFQISANCSNDGTQYQNSSLVGDGAGGFMNVGCRTVSGTTKVFGQGFDSAFIYTADKTVTQNAPHVVMLRHESGNLYISTDCGSESSVALGTLNSGYSSAIVQLGRNISSGTNYWPGMFGEVIFYNTALSSGNLSSTCGALKSFWSIP